MAMFTQLFQNALQNALQVAQAIFPTAGIPDEQGNMITVDVRADRAEKPVQPTVCHVGIDRGARLGMTKGEGVLGMDDTNSMVQHAILAPNSDIVFGLYTPLEPQRRYLADYLIWNMLTGFAVINGVRVDGYFLEVFRNAGAVPQLNDLFSVEYPAEDKSEARPFGLPFRAVVRLRVVLIANWSTPPFTASSGVLNLIPNQAPGNIGPPTQILFD